MPKIGGFWDDPHIGQKLIPAAIAAVTQNYALAAVLLIGALMPEVDPNAGRQIAGALVSGVDPIANRQVILGRRRVGMRIVFQGQYGDKRQYLVTVGVLAGHEVSAIGDLYLNEDLAELDGSGNVVAGPYAGLVNVRKHLGTDDQTVDTYIQSVTRPSWHSLGLGLRFDGAGNYCVSESTILLNPASIEITLRLVAHEARAGTILSFNGGAGYTLEVDDSLNLIWTDRAGTQLSVPISVDRRYDVTITGDNTGQSLSIVTDEDTTATPYVGGAIIPFIDSSNDELRAYAFDGANWALIGAGLGIGTVGNPALARMSGTRVAFIDSTNDSLRAYDWDGNTWALVGSGLDVGSAVGNVGTPALVSLSSTDVAFIDSTNDKLICYRFNGSTWSQVGNALTITGVGNPTLAKMSATRVALIDSGNLELRAYDFDGTDWAQVGNSLAIAGVGNPALTRLSDTQVAFLDSGNKSLRTYAFDGTDWAIVGSGLTIATVGNPALGGMGASQVAMVDSTNDSLRTYAFSGSAWSLVGSGLAITGVGNPALARLNDDAAGVLRVGALDGVAGGSYFAGVVDDPKITQGAVVQGDWGFADGSGDTADDASANGYDLTLVSPWTDEHRLRGCAYVVTTETWNQKAFPGGEPNRSFVVDGAICRDPRTSPPSEAFTRNPALQLAYYLENSDFGLNVDSSDPVVVDDDLLSAAADVCDEAVDLADGTTEPRYQSDYVFTTDKDPLDIINEIRTSFRGDVVPAGDKLGILAGAWRAPVLELTQDDLRGPYTWNDRPTIDANFTGVKGIYVDAANGYQPADFPPVTNGTYDTADGEQKLQDITLPATVSVTAAQRLAKIFLEEKRQGITFEAPFGMRALACQPGDNVTLTLSKEGWASKPFLVLNHREVMVDGAIAYQLSLQETAEAVFDWDAEETTVDPAPNTSLPSATVVHAPEDLELLSDATVQLVKEDGTIQPRIQVTWTAPADQFVLAGGKIEIQYREAGLSPEADWKTWSHVDGSVTSDFITADVFQGTEYDVRIRSINTAGSTSAWVEATSHQVGDVPAQPKWTTGHMIGNEYELGYVALDVAALTGELIAIVQDDTATELSAAEFDGVDFAPVGTPLSLGSYSDMRITPLSATRVALVEYASSNGHLAAYDWDGSAFALVGSAFTISGTSTNPKVSKMTASRVAYIDGAHEQLRAYDFNGSAWSLAGSGLNLSIAGTSPSYDVVALTETLVLVRYSDASHGSPTHQWLRCYEFDGATWTLVCELDQYGSQLYKLNATDVLVRLDSEKWRVFRFDAANEVIAAVGGSTLIDGGPASRLSSTDMVFIAEHAPAPETWLQCWRFGYGLTE